MSVINNKLPVRSYQVIRDRIGAILFTELSNQADLHYNPNLDAGVWVERSLPFNHTELPAVNISLVKGSFRDKTQVNIVGDYYFIIDCYTSAPSTPDINGDSEAIFRLHDLLGMCQSILEDSRFNTLGFLQPLISHLQFDEVIITDVSDRQKIDLYSVAYGRLIFIVSASDSNTPIDVTLLKDHITTAILSNTDKGYMYEFST